MEPNSYINTVKEHMKVNIQTLYEHTDDLGDTIKIEKIANVPGIILSIIPKDRDHGVSVRLTLSAATNLNTVLADWCDTTAVEYMKGLN